MCLAPITIKNPYYQCGNVGINSFHDTIASHIEVPCGSCPQCIAMRQGFFLQRVQMESLRSHLFMFTLTYNDESLIYADAGDYHIAIPYLPDIQNMFKRLRRDGHKFRVTYTTEYGSRRFRPHFHGILALDKTHGDPRSLEKKFSKLFFKEWRRNYSDDPFNPDWRPLFTPVYNRGRCVTFDFHFIEPVIDHDNDCAYYVSKYITKFDKRTAGLLQKINLDMTLTHEETSHLLKCIKPRCNTSKDFGDWKDPQIFAYISKCASRKTLFRYPQFYDIHSGKQMPMSPYYGKHVVSFEHLYNRLLASDLSELMSTNFFKHETSIESRQHIDSCRRQLEEFDKKMAKIAKRFCE